MYYRASSMEWVMYYRASSMEWVMYYRASSMEWIGQASIHSWIQD